MRTNPKVAPEEIEVGVAAAQRLGIAEYAHKSGPASGCGAQGGATAGYLHDGMAGMSREVCGTVDGSGCDL